MKKNKTIVKSAANAKIYADGEVGDGELELINLYARRPMKKDEVYVFSVILCDNDIDRDGERFTVDSLSRLEKLFVGKTGVIDHVPSAKNQTARIFSCCLKRVEGQKTADGDDYYVLKARAYLPKSKGNGELILAIDSGILKEVSISCAIEETLCSICKDKIGSCAHKKGERYGSKVCCGELTSPYDAYEWSFVAVPSQRRAGVTKSRDIIGKETDMETILKAIENKESFSADEKQSEWLCEYITQLKKSAKDGVLYRESLTREVVGLAAFVQPDISGDTMKSVAKVMTTEQLREFKNAFEKKKQAAVKPTPQLYSNGGKSDKTVDNGQFKI